MGTSIDRAVGAARAEPTTRTARTAKGRTIRIGETLFSRADERAGLARRSVQKQIEYWAELGRLVEDGLAGAELHALLEGRKTIERIALVANDVSSDDVPDAATVLAELHADRAAGTLAASVTSAPVAYDLVDDGRTLRRHDDEGNVSIGTFVDGRFVER